MDKKSQPDQGINLVPDSLLKNTGYAEFTSTVRSIAFVGFVVLIIATFGVSSFIFLNANKISLQEAERQKLVTQLELLKESEEKHFVIKDKTDKLVGILDERKKLEAEFDSMDQLVSGFPQSSSITSLEIKPNGTEALFSTPTSRTLAQLFDLLIDRGLYESVYLDNLSFSSQIGYQLGLAMISQVIEQ